MTNNCLLSFQQYLSLILFSQDVVLPVLASYVRCLDLVDKVEPVADLVVQFNSGSARSPQPLQVEG